MGLSHQDFPLSTRDGLIGTEMRRFFQGLRLATTLVPGPPPTKYGQDISDGLFGRTQVLESIRTWSVSCCCKDLTSEMSAIEALEFLKPWL